MTTSNDADPKTTGPTKRGADCPKCGTAFSPEFVVDATKDSRMSFKLSPGEGAWMMAKSIGDSLSAMADLMAASGRHIGGPKIVLMVEKIETEADGSHCFYLVAARVTKGQDMDSVRKRKSAPKAAA